MILIGRNYLRECTKLKRELLHLKGYMYQNFTMDENGAAFVKIDKATLEQFGVTASDTSQLVGALGEVKGICAWIIFIEEEDQIRVRLRSKGPVINTLSCSNMAAVDIHLLLVLLYIHGKKRMKSSRS